MYSENEQKKSESTIKITKPEERKDWKAWLKEGNFYIHGIVYMVVRIAVNVTMTV